MTMPLKVRATVTGFVVSGAVTVAAAVGLAVSGGVGPAYVLVPLTVLLALGWAFPLLVLRKEETEAFQLDEAFFVAMVLLLPPAGTIAVFLAATVLGICVRRRPLVKALFNIGQTVTAAGLGVAAAYAIAPMSAASPTPRDLGAAVVGAMVFMLVNSAAVSLIISMVEGRPAMQVFVDGLDLRVLVWAGGVALGLLAAIGGADNAWALVLAAVPMAVLNLVLREHAHARGQTERAEGLFVAAGQMHSSVDIGEVERAIVSASRSLLRCRRARIGATPPADGEIGVPVPGLDADQWLVVGQPIGVEPLGEPERELLSVVAGIAARAIQNARLLEREQEMRESLEELDRTKTDFVSSVSHELRTPLTSILGYVEMLSDGFGGELNPEQSKMLSIVDRNAERLLVLIEELLLMSRMESGTFRLSPAPVSVRALVDEAYQAMLPQLSGRGLEITVDVADDVDTIEGDPRQLDRALTNLLSNAAKFTPEGGRVGLSVRRHEGSLVIDVSDTGVGISPEDQAKIFDRFFRSASATYMAVPGAGLGLSITKMIVEAHRGRISVRSKPAEGTTMTITLPLQPGTWVEPVLAAADRPTASSAHS
jgi:signal transduction histidine kinase